MDLNSFSYAFKGLKLAFRSEWNLKVHAIISVAVILLGLYLKVNSAEWCLLLLCIGFVISFELVNTAIEKWVDLVSPEQNVKAGAIKDISAAAVLMASIIATVIGCIIFIPKISNAFL